MKRVYGSSRDVRDLIDITRPRFGFLFRGCQDVNAPTWDQRNHFGHRHCRAGQNTSVPAYAQKKRYSPSASISTYKNQKLTGF